MSTRPPVVPARGTESERLAIATYHPELVAVGEQVFTTDQQRLWLRDSAAWVMLSAPVHHGAVADEAAMLALATTATRGVWPLDLCYRTDNQTTYRFTDASAWEPCSVAGLTTVTEIDDDLATVDAGTGVTISDIDDDLATLSAP